jgi:hypothetical protein
VADKNLTIYFGKKELLHFGHGIPLYCIIYRRYGQVPAREVVAMYTLQGYFKRKMEFQCTTSTVATELD